MPAKVTNPDPLNTENIEKKEYVYEIREPVVSFLSKRRSWVVLKPIKTKREGFVAEYVAGEHRRGGQSVRC